MSIKTPEEKSIALPVFVEYSFFRALIVDARGARVVECHTRGEAVQIARALNCHDELVNAGKRMLDPEAGVVDSIATMRSALAKAEAKQ